VGQGGLGVRRATDIALPAFISSAIASSGTANAVLCKCGPFGVYRPLEDAKEKWANQLNRPFVAPPKPNLQSSWDTPLYEARHKAILESAASSDVSARLLASASKNAGAWLNAFPISSLGLKLSDAELRVCCAIRLGLKICQSHICRCGVQVDELGAHGLSCKMSAGRIPRHAQVNDLIRRALSSAGVPAILEPPGMCREDGKRPDGMSLFPWKDGRSVVWDFTCRFARTKLPTHVVDCRWEDCGGGGAK
jgi:hypothetical protein